VGIKRRAVDVRASANLLDRDLMDAFGAKLFDQDLPDFVSGVLCTLVVLRVHAPASRIYPTRVE